MPSTSKPSTSSEPSSFPTLTPLPTPERFGSQVEVTCNKKYSGVLDESMEYNEFAAAHAFQISTHNSDGKLEVSTCYEETTFDTTVELYPAGYCNVENALLAFNDDSQNPICADGASQLTHDYNAGEKFCILLRGFANNFGEYMISFNCTEVVPSPSPSILPTIFSVSGGDHRLLSLHRRNLLSNSDAVYSLTTSSEGCDFGYELSLEECEQAAVDYGAANFFDMSFGLYASFTTIYPHGCSLVDQFVGDEHYFFLTYNIDENAPSCDSNPHGSFCLDNLLFRILN